MKCRANIRFRKQNHNNLIIIETLSILAIFDPDKGQIQTKINCTENKFNCFQIFDILVTNNNRL